MKTRIKPRQIILSKRANVFYLEYAKLVQNGERVMYLVADSSGMDAFFNIPERNTMFILLGKGTSITDAAARKLAASNVVVGFVGNGGSPLISSMDMAFLTPQSEYRPTEYMQAWVRKWCDEPQRLAIAKSFCRERLDWTSEAWRKSPFASMTSSLLSKDLLSSFLKKIESAPDTVHLLSIEAEWARMVYRLLATAFTISDFTRRQGDERREDMADLANDFIDHGNYIAYGYAASALNVLGISYAFPVMHGKTRRGALVFDVADLYKDALVLPLAFHAAKEGYRDQEFREELIDLCLQADLMDRVIEIIISQVS
jgi:CRISPR-associated protein Cas1